MRRERLLHEIEAGTPSPAFFGHLHIVIRHRPPHVSHSRQFPVALSTGIFACRAKIAKPLPPDLSTAMQAHIQPPSVADGALQQMLQDAGTCHRPVVPCFAVANNGDVFWQGLVLQSIADQAHRPGQSSLEVAMIGAICQDLWMESCVLAQPPIELRVSQHPSVQRHHNPFVGDE